MLANPPAILAARLARFGAASVDLEHPDVLHLTGVRHWPGESFDAYDDCEHATWFDSVAGRWYDLAEQATTDPGLVTAADIARMPELAHYQHGIVLEGFYPDCWTEKTIHGMQGFGQVAPIAWAPVLKRAELTASTPVNHNIVGIDGHHGGGSRVGPWSFACQVWAVEARFDVVLNVYRQLLQRRKITPQAGRQSYALIERGTGDPLLQVST